MSKKLDTIRARVPGSMKRMLEIVARDRGETTSVIVREALLHYLSLTSRRRSQLAQSAKEPPEN